jgi:hypothetical protein
MFTSCRCSRKNGSANFSIRQTYTCCRNRAAPPISSCRRNSACWRAANPCWPRPMREPERHGHPRARRNSVAMAREIGILVAEGKHPALGDGHKLAQSFDREACLAKFCSLLEGSGDQIKARVSAPGPPEPPLSQPPPVPCPSRANIPQPVPSNRAHWHPRRQAAHPTTLTIPKRR